MKYVLSAFRFFYGLFVGGLVVQQFYTWFLQSVFTQLPQINYWQAIGLSSFLYLFNQTRPSDLMCCKEHENEDLIKYYCFITPWIILGMGFVTHLIIK